MEHPSKILKRHGLRPKKRLGQNFLVPGTWASRIADAVGAQADDAVLEVGPGLGALTEELLQRARRVIAVELDADMRTALTAELGEQPHLELIAGDARDVDLTTLGEAELVLAGNLPYYLSSPLLRWSVATPEVVRSATFTLQREVAQRVCAPPGGKDYGALSVIVQSIADARVLFRLPPGAFHPQPEVDSAVIRLDVLAQRRVSAGPAAFERVVFAAFGQRRKTLFNSLRGSAIAPADAIRAALEATGIDGGRRAETLSVEELGALTEALGAT